MADRLKNTTVAQDEDLCVWRATETKNARREPSILHSVM
jgi:hypothetical protein